jgi:hypothetical protein
MAIACGEQSKSEVGGTHDRHFERYPGANVVNTWWSIY